MGRAAQHRTDDEQPRPANEVRIRGRVSTAPEERVLPSGTLIVTLRVSVAREASPMTKGSKQSSDWVDCTAWGAKARRVAARWRAGDVVEVEGCLRRRFHRGAAGTSTRLEVEVLSGRLVSRSPSRTGKAAAAAAG
ncbi:MAG TPA: single-stranded DNA-binding protein [Marmoricola sp.]|nr:single-stranded DNA-binding protein [Marmoricola sp.]